MTITEAITALRRTGLDFLADTEARRVVCEAARELQIFHTWSWRRLTVTGSTQADFTAIAGPIESVIESTGVAMYPRSYSEYVDPLEDGRSSQRVYTRSSPDNLLFRGEPRALSVTYFQRGAFRTGAATVFTESPASDSDNLAVPVRAEHIVLRLARAKAKEMLDRTEDAIALKGQVYGPGGDMEQLLEGEMANIDEPQVILQRNSDF